MQGLKMFVILKLFHFPSWDMILNKYKPLILSVSRYWIFDPGWWVVDPLMSLSESGCWILNPKSSVLDSHLSIMNAKNWVFASRSWMFDACRVNNFWGVN
ncbi:MAG: hypothetical protein ABIH71_06335 [Candidatus Omnitrophota bacterium]|nr:hypothetical protein [Candidatus Omnitrophota bacterium]